MALHAAVALAAAEDGSRLIGCRVYAARMHRTRFEDMEPGPPEEYPEEGRLGSLRDTHDLISEGMTLIPDACLAAARTPSHTGRRTGILQPLSGAAALRKAALPHPRPPSTPGGTVP